MWAVGVHENRGTFFWVVGEETMESVWSVRGRVPASSLNTNPCFGSSGAAHPQPPVPPIPNVCVPQGLGTAGLASWWPLHIGALCAGSGRQARRFGRFSRLPTSSPSSVLHLSCVDGSWRGLVWFLVSAGFPPLSAAAYSSAAGDAQPRGLDLPLVKADVGI